MQAPKESGVTALSVTQAGPDPPGIIEKVKAWAE